MAKVILLSAPSWRLFNPRLHVPLGILYLAGSLRRAGHDVQVLDVHHEVTSWDAPGERLIVHHDKMEPCDVLGVSITTATAHWGSEVAEAWPARYRMAGGPHVTGLLRGCYTRFKDRKYFPGFDCAMAGESEDSLALFCEAIDVGADPARLSIPGLFWWEDSAIRGGVHPIPPLVTDLAPPAFDLWPDGFEAGALSVRTGSGREFDASKLPTCSIITSRGCPYRCGFCATARMKLREDSLERITAQIEHLARLGVKAVRVQDETFTIREERARKIADILHDHGMVWRAMTRVNLTNRDFFDYLSKRGCTELAFGVEHGSAKMLKAMGKGTTPEVNELSIKTTQDAGILAHAFLILGFPGETPGTVRELEEWTLRVRPDGVTFSIFQPYPGCDVWNRPGEYGVILPEAPFDAFWQVGLEGTEKELVLDLPTISKKELLDARRRLTALFEREIGPRDRMKVGRGEEA
jgi:radical SAM superfamily enzyme YgiQ (UPF0313 family)